MPGALSKLSDSVVCLSLQQTVMARWRYPMIAARIAERDSLHMLAEQSVQMSPCR